MFSTCSQSSIFQIHLCYFTLCQFFCQFTLILLYINRGMPICFLWACIGFPRAFYSVGFLVLPADLLLGSRHLFTALAAQTFS